MTESLPTDARPEAPVLPACDPALLRCLYDEARKALRRYRGLSEADRDDLTQRVVLAAITRLGTYREGKGTLRKWVTGIAHKDVLLFCRGQARRQKYEADYEHVARSETLDATTPEDTVSTDDLLDHLLGEVPDKERKIVELVKLAGLDFDQAAKLMGVSRTTAHTRYHDGMKALAEAVERWRDEQKSRGVVLLPFTIEQLFEAGRAPRAPDEEWARAWERISSALSRRHEPSPPDNDVEPQSGPSSLDARKAQLLRMFGVLGSVVAGIITAAALGPDCSPRRAQGEPPAAVVAPESPSSAPLASVSLPATSAPSVAEAAPSSEAGAPALPGITTARTVRSHNGRDYARQRDEVLLLGEGRSALASGKAADALATYDKLVRLFPRTENGAAREQLRRDACAQARESSQGGSGSVTARCAGMP